MITFLDELSDEALKKEATSEAKSDTFSVIMKVSMYGSIHMVYICICGLHPPFLLQSLRHLCRRVPAREDIESFRLKMILRLVGDLVCSIEHVVGFACGNMQVLLCGQWPI